MYDIQILLTQTELFVYLKKNTFKYNQLLLVYILNVDERKNCA